MSQWQPLENGEWIEPGMANTSRPWSMREARRDERAALHRRLDDEHAARQPADETIAPRKVRRDRRRSQRKLRHQDAALRNLVGEVPVCRGVHAIQPGADDRDGGGAAREPAAMGGRVDAEREAADDAVALVRERVARTPARRAPPGAWRCGFPRSRWPAGSGGAGRPWRRALSAGPGSAAAPRDSRRPPGREDGVRAPRARRGLRRRDLRAGRPPACRPPRPRRWRRPTTSRLPRRRRGSRRPRAGRAASSRKCRERGRGEASRRRPGARLSVVWGKGGQIVQRVGGRAR